MEFFATAALGLEPYLKLELEAAGATEIRPLKGQVSFHASFDMAQKLCLTSHIASRIYLVLDRISATDSDELYQNIQTIDWTAWLPQDVHLSISASGTTEALRSEAFTAQRAKDGIAKVFEAHYHRRLIIDNHAATAFVHIRLNQKRALISLDLAGTALIRRGYSQLKSKESPIAPLRSDYGAALIYEALGYGEKNQQSLVIDNFGAGSLMAEALMIVGKKAPSLNRFRFGFEGLKNFNEEAFEQMKAELKAEELEEIPLKIFAFDTRRTARLAATKLLAAAGFRDASKNIDFVDEKAFKKILSKAWGLKLISDQSQLEAENLQTLSSEIAQFFSRYICDAKKIKGEGHVLILSNNADFDAALGVESETVFSTILGNKEARLLHMGASELLTSVAERPCVDLVDSQGKSFAWPLFQATADQFALRLRKNYKNLSKWAEREWVSCYRLYDADLADYKVAIELYQESEETARRRPFRWLQISEYQAPKSVDPKIADLRLMDVLSLAAKILEIEPRDIFLKRRLKAKGGSQYVEAAKGAERLKEVKATRRLAPGSHLIDEGGLCFEVNFEARLDCGIFLDHRITRELIREKMKATQGSKRFLNLFAYTGTASVYAADGGAKFTTTVDLSRPSLDWAARNMARNGFEGENHEFVQADVLKFVAEERKTKHRWDLIFCDVPTFSNSSRMGKKVFDVQKDHVELIIGISRLLTRNGEAIFSCNLKNFKIDVEALLKAKVEVEDITAETIPHDFERNPKIHHAFLVRRLP